MSQRSRATGGSEKLEQKYDISKECKLQLFKKLRIEDLDDNYMVAAHPFPQMEGELLVFQANAKDQEENEDSAIMTYRDFSLMKRLETNEKQNDVSRMSALEKKKYMEADQQQTKIQCLELDNSNLLSTADWSYFHKILNEVQGLGWVQTLPVGKKSSTPLQFNMMHVLPSSKIPFAKIPIDVMIKNKVNFKKKRDKRLN